MFDRDDDRSYVLQTRRFGTGPRASWLVTEKGSDAPLMGPDRFGNHNGCDFATEADAIACARWRIERLNDGVGLVERGPIWQSVFVRG